MCDINQSRGTEVKLTEEKRVVLWAIIPPVKQSSL
jgi:hypothetical protein